MLILAVRLSTHSSHISLSEELNPQSKMHISTIFLISELHQSENIPAKTMSNSSGPGGLSEFPAPPPPGGGGVTVAEVDSAITLVVSG